MAKMKLRRRLPVGKRHGPKRDPEVVRGSGMADRRIPEHRDSVRGGSYLVRRCPGHERIAFDRIRGEPASKDIEGCELLARWETRTSLSQWQNRWDGDRVLVKATDPVEPGKFREREAARKYAKTRRWRVNRGVSMSVEGYVSARVDERALHWRARNTGKGAVKSEQMYTRDLDVESRAQFSAKEAAKYGIEW